MPNTSVTRPQLDESRPPSSVSWRAWPLCESLGRTLLVLVGLLLMAIVIRWTSGATYVTLLACVALMASLWRFFVPMEFELDDQGIVRRLLGRRQCLAWQSLGCCEVCKAGLLLLPNDGSPGGRSAMASFHGFYLPCGPDNRSKVLVHVRNHAVRIDRKRPRPSRLERSGVATDTTFALSPAPGGPATSLRPLAADPDATDPLCPIPQTSAASTPSPLGSGSVASDAARHQPPDA